MAGEFYEIRGVKKKDNLVVIPLETSQEVIRFLHNFEKLAFAMLRSMEDHRLAHHFFEEYYDLNVAKIREQVLKQQLKVVECVEVAHD